MRNLPFLPALFLSLTCTAAWAQVPVGGEFQVNSYTTSRQYKPAVASDANGGFVVVWGSDGQDGSQYGVFGQRFNGSGVPQGGEFPVNSYTTSHQFWPAAASDANGNFVVVWESYTQDATLSWGVFGQRFDAAGAPQGGEFRVNSYTTGNQLRSAVASDANGNFVAVWTSIPQDGSGTGIFGQRFDAAGAPQGGEFQVNSYTTSDQRYGAVASDANGNFVVVWQSNGQDGSGTGVFGQLFNAAGVPQGSEFQVNSYTTSRQSVPAVAADTNGNFVVVWESYGQDGSSTWGAFGQRFSAAGVPQGAEFQVNCYTTNIQRFPSAALDAAGNFVVVWQSYHQDGSHYGVFGRRFSAAGVPQGAEFQVNSYTTSGQQYAAVTANPSGNFVVVWQSANQDGWGGEGIFGQRFGDLIFMNGFE